MTENLFDICREHNRKRLNSIRERMAEIVSEELPEGVEIEAKKYKKKEICPKCYGLDNDCVLCGGLGVIEHD